MISSKAAILTQIGQPLEVVEVFPQSLSRGQVLVEVLISGLCGAQLQEIKGHKGNAGYIPHLLGHEGLGIVREIDTDVTQVQPGDKVMMHWRPGAGIEANFPIYKLGKREITSGKLVTLATHVIVSENRLTPVDNSLSDDLYTLCGCVLSTAISTCKNFAIGRERIAVLGCGGLGSAILMTLSTQKSIQTFGIDNKIAKKEWISTLGANYHQSIEELDLKFDLVIDTTGNPDVMSSAMNQVEASGTMVLLSQPDPDASLTVKNVQSLFAGEGKIIVASQAGGFHPVRDFPQLLKDVKSQKHEYSRLVSHRFPLEKINDALDLLRYGAATRILIDIQANGEVENASNLV